MREVTTLLYGPYPTLTGRTNSFVLSDSLHNYDLIRVYAGFDTDGYTVNEWDLRNRPTNISNCWVFHNGSVSTNVPCSIRWNDFNYVDSTRTLTVKRAVLTYLNNGTNAYTNNTNNDWGPRPIYKIVGVKFV